MSKLPSIAFAKPALPKKGVLVAFTRPDTPLAGLLADVDMVSGGQVGRAIGVSDFKSAARTKIEILAPAGCDFDRLIVVGLGAEEEPSTLDIERLGGVIAGAIGKKAEAASILLEEPKGGELTAQFAAHLALGLMLRSYAFDAYKTVKKDDADDEAAKKSKKKKVEPKPVAISLMTSDAKTAKKLWTSLEAVGAGTLMARDLVNEPANILGPIEFAERAESLSELGVDVEILDDKKLTKIGMKALLGVAQGSRRPARVAIMRWKGGKAKDAPVALVGKGVVFDTGGISIKPAGGMEDMKGDMGGAAAVVGAMRALAGRKAKCNVIGIIGLVENMPDGNAQRPGDIVTSLSGQTIEVINTDAEGRLVLCDIMTYIQREEKPQLMIDLATLTGAVIVALGHHRAGIYSNDDQVASDLISAGEASGDKVWRLPLGPEYDKMIDSRFADMKNVGGRWAGSVTAAQFLKRFVEEGTLWAHVDLAGPAMGGGDSDTNKSWGSGFGVRLLDRLISDRFE